MNECKLSVENRRLEKEIEQLKKDVSSWRGQFNRKCEMEQEWVEDFRKKLEGLGYLSVPHTEAAIIALLNDVVEMRKKLGIPTDSIKSGRCENTHCRKYVSTDWKFCPECGHPMGNTQKSTVNGIFDEIEAELPIKGVEHHQWKCRWIWARRRLIEGKD